MVNMFVSWGVMKIGKKIAPRAGLGVSILTIRPAGSLLASSYPPSLRSPMNCLLIEICFFLLLFYNLKLYASKAQLALHGATFKVRLEGVI